MGIIGVQNEAYNQWLRDSAAQAQKVKNDLALELAACQLRGAWILYGCPKIQDSRKTIQSTLFQQMNICCMQNTLYLELIGNMEKFGLPNGVDLCMIEKARKETNRFQFSELIQKTRRLFEKLAPPEILVIEVMQS